MSVDEYFPNLLHHESPISYGQFLHKNFSYLFSLFLPLLQDWKLFPALLRCRLLKLSQSRLIKHYHIIYIQGF